MRYSKRRLDSSANERCREEVIADQVLTDLCILQVWVRNQYRVRFSTNSAIWWRLKKTINAEEALLEWIPIIGSEYRNW